jgi:putative aminopeptidase FrvX
MRSLDPLIDLLQELCLAYGPSGQEEQIRQVCERELRASCEQVWTDEAENLIGYIQGRSTETRESGGPFAIRIMAHMDENSMIVKRINPDGTLRVNALGGLHAGNLGQGPVDILADGDVLPGILAYGSMHTTPESKSVDAIKKGPIEWEDVSIFTRRSDEELKSMGVHPGTRVVVSKSRRQLVRIQDCVGGPFLDNRAGLLIVLAAIAHLRETEVPPAEDVYVVMSTQEEVNAAGASFASRKLPGELTFAVDVGPVAAEYHTVLSDDPIVVYRDSTTLYTKSVADRLMELGQQLGMTPQAATFESYTSDASTAKRLGHSARAAMLCVPTANTHGYEIVVGNGLVQTAKLLAVYLQEAICPERFV